MDDLERLINVKQEDFFFTSDEIYTHLVYIHNLLQANNIKHFLLYGTLLGCIREKNVIPYDYDFDFGVMFEDVEKILALKQPDPDYEIKKMEGYYHSKSSFFKKTESNWRVSFGVYYKDNKAGDLYVYHNCKDKFTRRYDPVQKLLFWPKSVFPTILIEKLETGKIRDVEFPIPNHPTILLEYYYGPMWTTPIKAESQGGEGDKSIYDYYGSYMFSTLESIIAKTKEELAKDGIEYDVEKPGLDESDIEFIFPPSQIEWVVENEKIKLKDKRKKTKKLLK